MKVNFSKIFYKNFKAVGGDGCTILLNTHKTTLVSGLTGSGKSSLISALCYVLFGKGFGKITKDALINSINLKQLLVEVWFEIGTNKYHVKRGMKPNIFEIYKDDILISIDPSVKDYQKVLEQQILKFTYKSFTQMVVAGGSEYVPFMLLSAADRRAFVEDLLDIKVFSHMNNIVKDEIKSLKSDLKDLEFDMKSLLEKISMQKSFITKLQKDKTENVVKIETALDSTLQKSILTKTNLEKLSELADQYSCDVSKRSDIEKRISDVKSDIRHLSSQLYDAEENKTFYHTVETCPTCTQIISDSHKQIVISDSNSSIEILKTRLEKLNIEVIGLTNILSTFDSSVKYLSKIQSSIVSCNSDLRNYNQNVKSFQTQLDSISEQFSGISDEEYKLKEYALSYKTCDKTKSDILSDLSRNDFIQQSLSDSGIKAKVIKEYIPLINHLINKYLSELDFFVSFELSEEFNETIKSRHRDNFTYSNFSDGQKRRIDIAILLAWMDVARAKNSISCNIIMLDEMDSSLDSYSADLFLQTLKKTASENIFIISHKNDMLIDKVDNSIEFVLESNFTVMK